MIGQAAKVTIVQAGIGKRLISITVPLSKTFNTFLQHKCRPVVGLVTVTEYATWWILTSVLFYLTNHLWQWTIWPLGCWARPTPAFLVLLAPTCVNRCGCFVEPKLQLVFGRKHLSRTVGQVNRPCNRGNYSSTIAVSARSPWGWMRAIRYALCQIPWKHTAASHAEGNNFSY